MRSESAPGGVVPKYIMMRLHYDVQKEVCLGDTAFLIGIAGEDNKCDCVGAFNLGVTDNRKWRFCFNCLTIKHTLSADYLICTQATCVLVTLEYESSI